MIDGRKIIALIPGQRSSKRTSRKNSRIVGGKPMIAWTIDAARGSHYVDHVTVWTDDPETIDIALGLNCQAILRLPELAPDEAKNASVARNALHVLEPDHFDYIVLLQPTSPLRLSKDVDGAIELCAQQNAATCVSASAHYVPWRINGAVYVATTEHIGSGGEFVTAHSLIYMMPVRRSLDVSTEADLARADMVLSNSHAQN